MNLPWSARALFLVLLLVMCVCTQCSTVDKNAFVERDNSTLLLERTRRFISYPVNGGIAKLILGFLAPVRFMHPLPRSLNCGVNVQANYVITPELIFPHPESIFKNRALDKYTDRTSRAQVYRVLEKLLRLSLGADRKTRECLLRTVCEVADAPLSHNGLVGELLDVILTPQEIDVLPPEFLLARKYGENGVACERVFSGCPWGYGLLDRISTTTL